MHRSTKVYGNSSVFLEKCLYLAVLRSNIFCLTVPGASELGTFFLFCFVFFLNRGSFHLSDASKLLEFQLN